VEGQDQQNSTPGESKGYELGVDKRISIEVLWVKGFSGDCIFF